MATNQVINHSQAFPDVRPLPRRSSSLHKAMMARLRPLPFQYIWAVWHSKPNPVGDKDLTQIYDEIPDIATFYRVYNNLPWDQVQLKHSIHFFRKGVKPLWEDTENIDGGCLVLKVRKGSDREKKIWEEICLICCGGELQAALAHERDHVLGMSYSPRLYWTHIYIWTKNGGNVNSIEMAKQTIFSALSPNLRPLSGTDYYYKKHSEHIKWCERREDLL